jgi:putative nucleotidyltransferase with HDIG domain
MPKAEEILRQIEDLPLINASTQRLIAVFADEYHSAKDVTDIIECDSVLTSRVLRLVNSSAYPVKEPLTSVASATSYLGDYAVMSVAFEASTSKMFAGDLSGYQALVGDFWAHSLRSAIAARELVPHCTCDLSADCVYTAALLHDIGKSVLSLYLGGQGMKIAEDVSLAIIKDFVEGERKVLGVDHAEVGYKMAEKWGLADKLVVAIKYHHSPADAPEEYRPLVYGVHLADIIAMMGGAGTGDDTLMYKVDEDYGKYFDISSKVFEKILLRIITQYESIASVFGINKNQEDGR